MDVEKSEILPVSRESNGRFVKGQSGNIKGRAKGINVSEQFRKWLEADARYFYDKIKEILDNPKDGSRAKILTYVLDRLYGKVAHVMEVTTNDGVSPANMNGQGKEEAYDRLKWCEGIIKQESEGIIQEGDKSA